MKSTILLLTFIVSATIVLAQRISKVAISNAGIFQTITIATDDNAVINLSPNGDLVNYGTEYFSEKIQNYSRLEKFNGRVDLFAATDDVALQGKLKYIGRTAVTYYPSYEVEAVRGKVKTIGTLSFTYYMPYDDASQAGKIKSIGSSQLQYFTNFENEALRGKLKSMATTGLTYYSSFDDSAMRGKIKSVGQVNFTYYSSFEKQYAGSMKTGNQNLIVAGVNYLIQ
jgi:hypothetical protein